MRKHIYRAWDGSEMLGPSEIHDLMFNYGENYDHVKAAKVMQYTGCRDSKGVDIYEGDIIEWKEEDIIFEVKWSPEDCGYICIRDNCAGSMNQQYIDHFEVVGNIYENPELLEVLG